VLLGFDPGRDKCGLAVMGLDRRLHFQAVVTSADAIAQIETLIQEYPVSFMVIGDQTTSKQWQAQISTQFPTLRIITVDERFSSEEARKRYWQNYPPKGLSRLIPLGMRQPPRAIDDIVAVILIERYLNRLVS
jgi:RNase H-fold protein (predicted Holliday junction resolvase)